MKSAPGQWSRDGTRLVARRFRQLKLAGGETLPSWTDYVTEIYPANGGEPQVLTTATPLCSGGVDWSADGQWILGYANNVSKERAMIQLLPLSAAPQAETQARIVTTSADHDLWQTYFSPDERWISFVAINRSDGSPATVYIVPTAGGEWMRITDGKFWEDKPRWAPDGKTIYFTSNRSGFYNVWGIRFNPIVGKPVGEPFRVTAFESPSHMTGFDELGISDHRLVLTIREITGNIWTLENVDK